jgi:ABC-type transport system substrate-binding protein
VPLGREFRLARNAYWSNGEPVSAADVEATIRLLNQPERWEGAIPSLGKLLADRVDLGGDVLRVRLDLKQGYLDSLSLMTFKVLPRGVEAERVKFNREAPVGSGPFRYGGAPKSLNGRLTTRFLANPHYGVREGRFGLPRIREIQFVEYPREGEHPVDGLLTVSGNTDGVHFVADVPAGRAKDLKENHLRTLNVVGPLKTRRVWFLAVNHRRPPLQNNMDLRLAIAYAIHREEVLDKCFRGGYGKEVHQALNGPFPAGSWACNPNVGSLHQPELARGEIKRAEGKGGGPPWKLFLKYPTGDPAVKQAVEMICQQVAETIQVGLIPSPVPPQKLREDVERSHDYELAYYYHDFPSEAYWLAPLFDPDSTDRGGTNYLGYADPDLNAQLQAATNVRDFEKVQGATHLAHRLIAQNMPLIPLWQLDTFIAYRKGVRPTTLDPLLGFSDVEQWSRED